MAENLRYNSAYDGGSLILMGHLLLCGDITYTYKPTISDYVDIDSCDGFRHKLLDADEL